MDQQQENFQVLFNAIYLVLGEFPKHKYLPDWLYNLGQSETKPILQLKVPRRVELNG